MNMIEIKQQMILKKYNIKRTNIEIDNDYIEIDDNKLNFEKK